ncbi:MAG: hypothetical protein GY832_41480 [Chloroflexi bacterium]|nr:hypothetical protein [Chloroflexota bacterium]
MTVQMQTDARPFLLRRWFLLTLSVFVPLILLSLILSSVRTAVAEPLAPTSTVSGIVVDPDGVAITGTAPICLNHFSPNPDEGVDWWDCKDTEIGGGFTFTGPIPSGELFVIADAPGYGDWFPSLPKPFHLEFHTDTRALDNVTLTHASFAGMVFEPDGTTLADGGSVSVVDRDWNDVAWGDYYTGGYAVGGVPSGNFMLVAHPPEDSLFWHSEPVPVTVTEGSQYVFTETQPISLELNMAQLAVYVENMASNPITANVYLWDETGVVDMWGEATPDHPAVFGDLDVGAIYMIEAWPRWEDVPMLANSMIVTVVIAEVPTSRTLTLREPNVVGVVTTPEDDLLPPAFEWEELTPHPARVYAHNVHEGFTVEVQTNPAGEFSLALPPGEYDLEAHPNGNLAFTYTKSLQEHISAPMGTVMLPINVKLTYPSVDGAVFDPLGNPLPPDACLDIWLENMEGEWMASIWYCGVPGSPPYMLGGVPDGDYWLKTDGVPELGFFPPAPIFVHVPPGSQYELGHVQTHDIHLVRAQLEVFVEHPSGALGPANVVLWDEWGFEAWSDHMFDSPAQFGVPPGDYWLQAWPIWQDIPALANSGEALIHVGEAPMSYTLHLTVPDITGMVETPEGDPLPPAHDEEGNWFPHPAEVHVHNEDRSVDIWATTNPTGEFSLFLPDDEYHLIAKPLNNLAFDYTKSDPHVFSLTPAVTRPHGLGHILLTYPRVWGIVVDWEGNPVPTWVDLWNDDGSYWDGDDTYWHGPDMKPFLFGGMPEGHYYAQANPPANNPVGYGPSNIVEFDVPPTYTEQITLSLGIANVLGDVRLPLGYPHCADCPVPWVDVKVLHDPDDGFEKWATTGEDGRFAFMLEPGNYALKVELPPEWRAEWSPPSHPVTFTLGAPPDQHSGTIYLEPSNAGLRVTGQVHKPDSTPPPPHSTWIDLCDDEGLCFGNDVAPSGRFTVPVLPGIYEVWVWVDPMTNLAPPADDGFAVGVYDDLELDPISLRSQAERTAHVNGRVMLITPTAGLTVGVGGIALEAWTDSGDWASADTAGDGNYTMNLFPGHWHGGPVLTPEQKEEYILTPPRRRDGHLEDGETVNSVNFYLRRRDASIQGQVVEVGQTTPITSVDAIVFAEHCIASRCDIVAESEVVSGTFNLHVLGNRTYNLGIWLPSGGYMPGPPVTVTVLLNQDKTGVRVEVVEAGTRIYGRLMDADLNWVEIDASVYGYDENGVWVEDYMNKGDDPYQYDLYVPTPVDTPITWTLGLWVDPKTGYIADPSHPQYTVVVQPGQTDVPQIMYVQELDTQINGTVGIVAGGTYTPARHAWVYAEGSAPETMGFYFETQTDASGAFSMTVLPGEYKVSAYLPPDLAGGFFPPHPRPWASPANNPVELLFRHRPPGGELEICGDLSVLPSGALSDSVSIPVFGWADDGSFAEVTGTLASGYCMSVISDTTWYLWAAYEDPENDAFYHSQEKSVHVGNVAPHNVNLDLVQSDFELPETECWSFDPTKFKRLILPAYGDLPEPLVEIQGGTMPVTDTVEVCATPVVATPGGQRILGFAYELDAWDSQGNLITQDFDNKVRLIFYLDADVVGNTDPADMEMAYYSTVRQEWISLDDVVFTWDDPYWFCTGKIEHFSRIGVRGPESDGGGENQIYLPLVLRNFDG